MRNVPRADRARPPSSATSLSRSGASALLVGPGLGLTLGAAFTASARGVGIPAPVVMASWAHPLLPHLLVAVTLAMTAAALYIGLRRARSERAFKRALGEREQRLRVALWGSGDELWDWDVRASTLSQTRGDALNDDTPPQVISAIALRTEVLHPDDAPRVIDALERHIAGETESYETEHRVRTRDGAYIWVRARGRVVERDEAGRALRVAGTWRDITHAKSAERERRIAAEVIASMGEAVVVTDLAFRFVSVNPAFERITGYSAEAMIGLDSSLLDSSQQGADFYAAIRAAVIEHGRWHGEVWQRRANGDDFLCWLELHAVADAARDGARTHFVGVLSDITERKRVEQELRYLANYDPLTGLPNRTMLSDRLAHALIRARRQGSRVALYFLDLDRFKHVNDSLGHAAGDRLLKAVARRLSSAVTGSTTVARLGGDEFTVIAEELSGMAAAEALARQLVAAFEAPLRIDGASEVVISPSIGIALYPDHAELPTDLLKFADAAMYRAKEQGRNTFAVYSPALETEARRRAELVNHLHKALDRNEFRLVYQPKLRLASNELVGVEALLRWNQPQLGAIGPQQFVGLAEDTGLIVTIGDWVLREALGQLQRWRKLGLGDVEVAVNVSMLQLLRSDLAITVGSALAASGIGAQRLVLEITESVVMANAERAIATLGAVKALGVSIAIDDFGTGYSSLSQLKRLPIDTLKIDKSFVGDIESDRDDEAITATVIKMAHSLGLDVVAEGVETPAQLAYLRERGCNEAQGFLISPPLEPDAALEFLLAHRHRGRT